MENPAEGIPLLKGKRVIVLGDVMLDRFVYGEVSRVSPEAPVPVLLMEKEISMPGGAGNVARNIAALGGKTMLIGAAGRDPAGDELEASIGAEPLIEAHLVRDGRPTTQKIRYVAGQQQLLRADAERHDPVEPGAVVSVFERLLPQADAVVLSDYAKGVLTPEVLRAAIAAARKAAKPVVADPKLGDIARYDGVTVLTPNRGEAAAATGIAGEGDEETRRAAEAILERVPATPFVLVTRGANGMTLVRRGGAPLNVPARAREVFDVSGAGDTVTATLALSLGAGLEIDAAITLANAAAGLVVAKRGTAVVTADELLHELRSGQIHSTNHKIVGLDRALKLVAQWRERGDRIGFTNGCFDLIHPGHISQLSQARTACDRLIIGLNSDASVKRLKGPSRPVQNEMARAVVLASVAAVDLLIVFEEDTPAGLIRAIRPDVLIKGKDYTVEQVVGADFVQSYGGRVFLTDLEPGHSTSGIISRLNEKSG